MTTIHRLIPATAIALLLGACSLTLQNTEPARDLARAREPATGSLYAGWRVFQQRCASCHGKLAAGGGGAPNLLLRVRDVGPRRFVDVVLRRYGSDLLPVGGGSPRETLLDEVVDRRQGELTMPAWQEDPVVSAHVMDLYAYLSARADGRQGAGTPPR